MLRRYLNIYLLLYIIYIEQENVDIITDDLAYKSKNLFNILLLSVKFSRYIIQMYKLFSSSLTSRITHFIHQ